MFEQRNIRTSGSRGLLAVTALSCVVVGGITSNEAWGQEECAEEVQELIPSNAGPGDYSGTGVSISGDLAIVGAYGDDDAGSDSGAAYVFVRSEDGRWTEEATLRASNASDLGWFGFSVSVSGNLARTTHA